MLLRATAEAGLVLARLGRCEPALEYIARAVEDGGVTDATTTVTIYSAAACACHLCGNPERAAEHLAAALKIACTDRAQLAEVLEANVDFLASIDGGVTLARVFEGLHDVDLWWQA
jgi:hypothetical protein